MGVFDKLGAFLRREGADVSEMAGKARDAFDDELTRREAELAMTPSEKIEAIQRSQREQDNALDAIAEKIAAGRREGVDGEAEAPAEPTSASAGDAVEGDAAEGDDTEGGAVEHETVAAGVEAGVAAEGPVGQSAAGVGGAEAPVEEAKPSASRPPASTAGGAGFEKTPAQLRYEEARASADALLDELRSELRNES